MEDGVGIVKIVYCARQTASRSVAGKAGAGSRWEERAAVRRRRNKEKRKDQVGYLGLRAARLPRLDDKRGCLNRAAVLGVCGLSESGSSCDGGDGPRLQHKYR